MPENYFNDKLDRFNCQIVYNKIEFISLRLPLYCLKKNKAIYKKVHCFISSSSKSEGEFFFLVNYFLRLLIAVELKQNQIFCAPGCE